MRNRFMALLGVATLWSTSLSSCQALDYQVRSFTDIDHYRCLCAALATTPRLMAAVDATIDTHGGWSLGAQRHVP